MASDQLSGRKQNGCQEPAISSDLAVATALIDLGEGAGMSNVERELLLIADSAHIRPPQLSAS